MEREGVPERKLPQQIEGTERKQVREALIKGPGRDLGRLAPHWNSDMAAEGI